LVLKIDKIPKNPKKSQAKQIQSLSLSQSQIPRKATRQDKTIEDPDKTQTKTQTREDPEKTQTRKDPDKRSIARQDKTRQSQDNSLLLSLCM
jgi:hypothetical protein